MLFVLSLSWPAAAQDADPVLKVSATFDKAIYDPNDEYTEALIVTVKDETGQPLEGAEVTAVVWVGQIGLSAEPGTFEREVTGTTGAAGVVKFGLKTPKISKGPEGSRTADDAEEAITAETENPSSSFAVLVSAAKDNKTGEARTMGEIGSGFVTDFGSRRVASEVFVGTTLSQSYDDQGKSKGFDQTSMVGRFRADTMYGLNKPWDFHTGLEIQFSGFPTTVSQDDTQSQDKAGEPTITDLADAYTGSLVLILQPGGRFAHYSNTSTDEKKPFDALRHGFIFRASAISRDTLGTDKDNTIYSGRLGYLFTHHQTAARSPELDNTNVFPIRFVEISYGYYEEIFDLEHQGRLIVEAGLRLQPLGGNNVPFYAGLYLNAGKGQDDFRLFAGFLFHLDRIVKILDR
jgi:hypothetical protein